jgi:hypothetical protein
VCQDEKAEHWSFRHAGSCRTMALIKSYLTERYQRVIVHKNTDNNSYSSWNLVQQSISQGSILDPLFFLLVINDVPIISKNDILVLMQKILV